MKDISVIFFTNTESRSYGHGLHSRIQFAVGLLANRIDACRTKCNVCKNCAVYLSIYLSI